MRVLIALFLFLALLLLAADLSASLATQVFALRSIGDFLAAAGIQWQSPDDTAEGGSFKFLLLALRSAKELPAFLPPLLLSVISWLLHRRRVRRPLAPNRSSAPTACLSVQDKQASGPPSLLATASPNLVLSGPAPAGPAAISLPVSRQQLAQTPSAPPPLPVDTRDAEFLPAALEILVAPPSPIAMWLMGLIAMTVLSGLAWSYFGQLDIHAVAPGKIQPSGRSKIVQPLEPGKVVTIRVENGSRIAAGDVLLELDPTETVADREAQARDLESASAEGARRKAAVKAAEAGSYRLSSVAFAPEIGLSVRQREETALAADLAQLRSNVEGFKAQIVEKEATKQRLTASIEARARLIKLSSERVTMREELDAKGAGSRALVIEALQQLETHVTTDVGERGQLIETDAAIVSLQQKIEQTSTQFVAEQMQKLVEAERKRDRLEQELIKAKSKSDRTVLRAPISGTVQQLTVTTVGQVVTTGQSLMTIVPLEGPIEVEALIANKDIGFVKAGQRAVVKVEAFPFTRYGIIEAEVIKVSRDAVDDRDTLNDAQTSARPQQPVTGTSSRTQTLVFPATLRLARHIILIDGEEVPLIPGMAVAVEIKTGERRAIDYILSPLREMVAQSAHER